MKTKEYRKWLKWHIRMLKKTLKPGQYWRLEPGRNIDRLMIITSQGSYFYYNRLVSLFNKEANCQVSETLDW